MPVKVPLEERTVTDILGTIDDALAAQGFKFDGEERKNLNALVLLMNIMGYDRKTLAELKKEDETGRDPIFQETYGIPEHSANYENVMAELEKARALGVYL